MEGSKSIETLERTRHDIIAQMNGLKSNVIAEALSIDMSPLPQEHYEQLRSNYNLIADEIYELE